MSYGTYSKRCSYCKGTKKVKCPSCDGKGSTEEGYEYCKTCGYDERKSRYWSEHRNCKVCGKCFHTEKKDRWTCSKECAIAMYNKRGLLGWLGLG